MMIFLPILLILLAMLMLSTFEQSMILQPVERSIFPVEAIFNRNFFVAPRGATDASTKPGTDTRSSAYIPDLTNDFKGRCLRVPTLLHSTFLINSINQKGNTMRYSPIIRQNRQSDLYFVDENNRIIYIPKDWYDEMPHQPGEIYGWYGQTDILNWKSRVDGEWLTSECQGWIPLSSLEKMQQVSKDEAKTIDPDLFETMEHVNKCG